MEEITFDWLDCSLFLMIANSEITDYYLSQEEIETIIEKTELLVSNLANAGISHSGDGVEQKFNKVFEMYNAIGDAAPEGKMNEEVLNEVQKCVNYLKDQKWFDYAIAKSLIADLINIAESDGEVDKNEKKSIIAIAEEWGVENPF